MSPRTPYGKVASNYAADEVLNESPLALIARLYDMACLEIARARACLGGGDASGKGQAVHRTLRCLSLLQNSINRDAGGDVALNLDRLYSYQQMRISMANLQNDDAIFAEVANQLRSLGDAWREVADRPESVAPLQVDGKQQSAMLPTGSVTT